KPKTLLQQSIVFPLLNLGTLALQTICKPIANRLKKEAGVNPRFRQFIINIAQVAGAALVYEVQKNSRGEARKEEKRQEELQEIRRKHAKMENEIEELKRRYQDLSLKIAEEMEEMKQRHHEC
ncbi:hypothetical protein EUTSA_v10019778mg, partial [Eutrema salsugineum]